MKYSRQSKKSEKNGMAVGYVMMYNANFLFFISCKFPTMGTIIFIIKNYLKTMINKSTIKLKK